MGARATGQPARNGTSAAQYVREALRAHVTLFNGPGGRSITTNVSSTGPAVVNSTESARFRSLKGHYAYELTLVNPPDLTTIVGEEIVLSHVHLTIGATRVVHGVKRGYFEARQCPSSGRARIHGELTFRRGAKASADARIAC